MLINKLFLPYLFIIAHFITKVNTIYAFLAKLNNFSVQNVVNSTTIFTTCLWQIIIQHRLLPETVQITNPFASKIALFDSKTGVGTFFPRERLN